MGCQHGRPQGSPCPHCLGINNPEDNQLENKDWETWARNEIKNELPNIFVIDAEDEIIAMCRTLLSQQAEKQREEIIAEVDEDHDIAYQAGKVDGYNEAKKDLTNNKDE